MIFIGNFFLINLFLGVINYTFDKIMSEHVKKEAHDKDIQSSQAENDAKVAPVESIANKSKNNRKNRSRGRIIKAEHDESGANIFDNSEVVSAVVSVCKDLNKSSPDPKGVDQPDEDSEKYTEPVKTILVNIRQKRGIVGVCAIALSNPYFSILRLVAIALNSITLAMIRYPDTSNEVNFQQNANVALTIFFLIENMIIMIGSGFRNYVREFYNIFELVLSLISRF